MKYLVLLFKNTQIRGIKSCSDDSRIKIERPISSLQNFGVEVNFKKYSGSNNFWAEITFFNGPVHSEKRLELVDNCGSIDWDTDLNHGMSITIIPDDLFVLYNLLEQNTGTE